MAFYYKDALIKYGKNCGAKTVKLAKSRFDLTRHGMPMPTYRMMDQPVWDDKKAFGHGNYHFQKWNEQLGIC
jgi:hypothetical protein